MNFNICTILKQFGQFSFAKEILWVWLLQAFVCVSPYPLKICICEIWQKQRKIIYNNYNTERLNKIYVLNYIYKKFQRVFELTK